MDNLAGLAEIVGPIGVLVVVAKLDGLREDIGEVKTDVRDLRASLVRHLEDHANA